MWHPVESVDGIIVRGYHSVACAAIVGSWLKKPGLQEVGDSLDIAWREPDRLVGEDDRSIRDHGENVDLSSQGLLGNLSRTSKYFDLRVRAALQSLDEHNIAIREQPLDIVLQTIEVWSRPRERGSIVCQEQEMGSSCDAKLVRVGSRRI